MRGRTLSLITAALFSSAYATERHLDLQDLSLLGVQAGGTATLEYVVASVGHAERWHSGDASEAEYKVCYRFPRNGGEITVVFASSGEMATPKGQVNSISLLGSAATYPERARCAQPANTNGNLTVTNGLALGMSPEQVKSLFGQQAALPDGTLEYQSCKQRYLAESEPAFRAWVGKTQCFQDPSRPFVDDCANVQVKFTKGQASSIILSRSQSIC